MAMRRAFGFSGFPGTRALGAVTVGVAIVATAAAGLALSGPVTATAVRAGSDVVIRPGTVQLDRETRTGPSDTQQCQHALRIDCYNPAQLQQAYDLPVLYARGITGRGVTIVIVDPYGSPPIASDLRTFDSTASIPNR